MSITYLALGGAAVTLTASTFAVLFGGDSTVTFVLFSVVALSLLFLASTVGAGGGLVAVVVDLALAFVAGVFFALAVVFVTGVGLALVLVFGAAFAVLQ